MTELIEFHDQYKAGGSHPILVKTAIQLFVEWQKKEKKNKGFKILSVQKIDRGIFVVYEN